eukprot:COSAG04_NODE_2482_length_4041_cov_4.531710_5_plen_57_part_00
MVFADEGRTSLVKVVSLPTMADIAFVIGEPPQVVSNYFHRLIHPRNAMRYVALFKD